MEDNFENAIDLINQEDFEGAKSLLLKCISKEPDNIEAYKNLGLVEVNLDNPIEAINAFLKVVEKDNDDATSLFYLASCYNRIGQKETAIEYFNKVIKIRPDYIDVYKSLAMIHIEYADSDSAIAIINKAIQNDNIQKDYTLYYILATASLMKKNHNDAIKYLLEGLKLSPNHTGLKNSLATCYIAIKEYQKAIEVLNEIIEQDDKNSLCYYNLGTCYQMLGQYKKALENYNQSYKLEPSITMLTTLASCAMLAQEYDAALSLYQNLVSLYPNDSSYRLAYIEALEAKQNYSSALENINMLLATDDKNVYLYKKKGTILRKLGLYSESIETFTTLLKRGKVDVEVYYNLAFNYVALNEFDNAKEMFKKCIMLEPHNPYAHKDLGVLYLKMNLYDWALDEIKTAIELEDDVGEFYYSLGVCYMMLNDIEKGKEALIKANELEKDNPDTLAYLAYIYLLQNEKDECFKLLQKAIKIDSNNFLTKAHMAKYYFSLNNYTLAKEFLLDIVQTTKDDETMNMLATCYMETNEFDNASGLYSKLVNSYPQNYVILTNLAKCEIETNKIKEAKEHLRKAIMIFEDYKPALELLNKIKVKDN